MLRWLESVRISLNNIVESIFMLKFLKKRKTGELEAFDQEKSNNWFTWAAPGLESRLDWMTMISQILETSDEIVDSQEYQKRLIDECAIRGSTGNAGWPYMVMGGRLYAVYLLKKIHGDKYPTVKEVQTQCIEAGLMRAMDYSDEEYEFIDKHIINHELNFEMSYSQVEQYYTKYSLRNNAGNKVYETPQFTVMRAAMAVAEYLPKHKRLQELAFLYRKLAEDRFNPPTPNYGGLGTHHFGLASCCLIAATDTAESIAAAGLIAYMQTVASAGLGIHLDIRMAGDPVSNGRVRHAGKLNYIRKLFGDTNANKQGMRGGAVTIYDTIYSPEIELMCRLQNPLTPEARRERRVNVAIQDNPFFANKVARREKYFTFTSFNAPDLYKALYSKDHDLFAELYAKYEADPNFVKDYRDAYETAAMFQNQRNEISTLFWQNIYETNRHSMYDDPIMSANLCMEVTNPTKAFERIEDLYGDGDPSKGEVGFCNIGSIPVNRHPFNPNDIKEGYEEYKSSVRAQLTFIDYAIEHNNYSFPALTNQSKARRNASVGMSGIATLFAEHNLKFDTPEGLKAIHMLSERHLYACIDVSIEMGEELGNAEWIGRTAWSRGMTPIDTYKKSIDKYVDSTLYFDWDLIKKRLLDNKGMRFSSLVAHMPGEQATRKGEGSNSLYPLFRLSVDKSDGTSSIPWAAKNNDLWGDRYQIAYDLSTHSQHVYYGVLQKFCDQTISLDEYKDRIKEPILESDTLVDEYLSRHRKGLKTAYYNRSLTPAPEVLKEIRKQLEAEVDEEVAAVEVAPKKSALDNIVINWDEVEMGSACTVDGACGT